VSIDYVEITGVYSNIRELYRKVTLESVIYRFLHPVADPTYIYQYLWSKGCRTFLIYFNNKPVGIVDITPCGDSVEVAILVIDAYQGRGIGKAVVSICREVEEMRYRYALAYVSPENYRAITIARKIGAEVRCRDICIIKYVLTKDGGEMCRS
jgi:Acetyltransferase (GNAT) family.